ncbi:hypothetical protein N7540_006560 [Penicillium herquei]|nr:hypothetical protein N7540_006560 [Penicillium herquei]
MTTKCLSRDALDHLLTLEDIRELMTRDTVRVPPSALNIIFCDKTRVQSALIQIKGVDKTDNACRGCEDCYGPWPGCIVVIDPKNRVSACANCYWRGQQKTCRYYRQPSDYRPRRTDKLFVGFDEAEDLLRLADLAKRSNEALNGMTEVFMSIDQSQSGPAAAIVKHFTTVREQKEDDFKKLFEAIQTYVGPKNMD